MERWSIEDGMEDGFHQIFENTHNFRRCEKIHSLHPIGMTFVEVEFSRSAPQRGAGFVGANVSMMQPISAHVVGNWLLQI